LSSFLQHALLGVACLALLGAGHRVATRIANRLVDRLISAFVFATAAAVLEALCLGVFKLGANPIALPVAAAATYLGVRAIPARKPSTRELAAAAYRRLSVGQTAGAGALVAVAVLLIAWPLRYPVLGFDGALYHLPEIAAWVKSGQPGSIVSVSYLLPFSNYPVTNEVALTWAAGISHSLVPVLLWTRCCSSSAPWRASSVCERSALLAPWPRSRSQPC
jgi:hypothetical protein